MKHTPLVRCARAVLWRIAPREDRDFLVADLDEDYVAELTARGTAAASRWYANQVLFSILPLLHQRLTRASPATSELWQSMFTDITSDLRSAVRRVRRTPVFSATIVLIVALGIGASTAVYSVVRGVLLTPLPFAGSERVVRLETNDPANPVDLPSDTWPDLLEWRAASRSYEAVAGLWEGGPSRVFHLADQTASVPVAVVTEHFDDVFGMQPRIGRLFRADEFLPEGPRAIALSERFWRTRFGSDSSVVGRVIEVSDTMRTIVGVLADAASEFPGPGVGAWIPAAPVPGRSLASRGTRWLALFARLKPGVTTRQAAAELQALVQRTGETDAQRARVANVIALQEKLTGSVRPMLLLLAAVVAIALLVAAGNVTILLLAQAESRTREMAIRASLGSAVSRLARKLVVESLLLAGAGGVAGLVVARSLVTLMIALYPGRLARGQDIKIDVAVLGVAFAMTIAVGLLSALPLVRRLTRADLMHDLRESTGTHSPRALRVRQVMAMAQLAFAVALVVSGGLLARSFVRLLETDPGFDARGVAYLPISTSAVRYATAGEMLEHLDAAERAVRALPGVTFAAGVNYLPLPGRIAGWGTKLFRANDPDKHEYQIQFRNMTPDYLSVMRIPLRRGRALSATDDAASAPVAMMNETLAREAFHGSDPIGQSVLVQNKTWTVVGVVGDMRYWGLARPVVGELFVTPSQAAVPQGGSTFAFRSLVIKTAGPSTAILAAARAAIHDADAALAVGAGSTLTERLSAASAPERFRATLVGSLATIAMLLAAFGLFAVTAHAVAARTREIGIRVALGATPRRIWGGILGSTLGVGATGTALGLALAWAASRGLQRFLVGAEHLDASMCAAVVAGFLIVSALAAAVPARRASRVDPTVAMREQ